jgi:hypothetical protein
MAAPTVTASLNKTAYAIGETMTLTVTYSDADRKTGTVSVVVTDAEGNQSAPVVSTYVIDPLTIAVTDAGRTWTKASDSGAVAVFTATAS